VIIGEEILEELGSGQACRAAEWLPPVDRVLELGCSTGYLTRRFAGKAKTVVGIDMNQAAVRRAASRNPAARLTSGDAEHLPFADRTFDAVVMLEVIEHTRSDAAALAEVRRVLKPGGVLILSTPHAGLFAWLDPYNVRTTIQRRVPGLARLASRLVRYPSGQMTDNMTWHRHYRVAELSRMVEKDFTIHRIYRGGSWLSPVTAAAISIVGRLWSNRTVLKWMFRVLNWDFTLPAGPLSYNLMMMAERKSPGCPPSSASTVSG